MLVLRWLTAILLLPGTVLVLVPAVLLRFTLGPGWPATLAVPSEFRFWVALVLAVTGLILSLWTMLLFVHFGRGTAAPWDPPRSFVARGPYRHVRNPMITGVFLMLVAEVLFFWSGAILGWMALFAIGNAIYIPMVEEKGLRQRFEDEYRLYLCHVPRWMPCWKSWNKGGPTHK